MFSATISRISLRFVSFVFVYTQSTQLLRLIPITEIFPRSCLASSANITTLYLVIRVYVGQACYEIGLQVHENLVKAELEQVSCCMWLSETDHLSTRDQIPVHNDVLL